MDLFKDILAVIGAVAVVLVVMGTIIYCSFIAPKERAALKSLRKEYDHILASTLPSSYEWDKLDYKARKEHKDISENDYVNLLTDISFRRGHVEGLRDGEVAARTQLLQSDLSFEVFHALLTGKVPWLNWRDLNSDQQEKYRTLLTGELASLLADMSYEGLTSAFLIRADLGHVFGFRWEIFWDAIRDNLRDEWNEAIVRHVRLPDQSLFVVDGLGVDEYEAIITSAKEGDSLGKHMLNALVMKHSQPFMEYMFQRGVDELRAGSNGQAQ